MKTSVLYNRIKYKSTLHLAEFNLIFFNAKRGLNFPILLFIGSKHIKIMPNQISIEDITKITN